LKLNVFLVHAQNISKIGDKLVFGCGFEPFSFVCTGNANATGRAIAKSPDHLSHQTPSSFISISEMLQMSVVASEKV
jgi:hypothetical protein